MSSISKAIQDLEDQQQKIESALRVLRSLHQEGGRGQGRPRGVGRAPRVISPEGRKRIADAQKRRWAKVHAAKK